MTGLVQAGIGGGTKMSRSWLHVGSGWEHGPIRYLYSANATQEKTFITGPNWSVYGHGGFPPEKSTKRSGYFAHRMLSGGFSFGIDARCGHVFARTKDWLFWVVPVAIIGFDTPPTVGNDYLAARCTEHWALATGDKYLGVGVAIVSAGPPATFQFTIQRFTNTGAFDVKLGGNSATFTAGTTVRYIVLALNTAGGADNCKLWVDGTAGAAVTSGTVRTSGHLLPDSRKVAGAKGADTGMQVVADDWCSAEGDAEADRPGLNLRTICYQARKNVTGENAWTGSHLDVDDERDAGVGDANTDTNVCTPGAADQLEIFGFPDLVDEAGQTATVEAVLLCWEQVISTFRGEGFAPAYEGHYPHARTTSSSLTDLSGDYGSGYNANGTPSRLWFSRLMRTTPEGSAWTPTLFNALQAGLKSRNTEEMGEFYAIPIGDYIDAPADTPTPPGDPLWEDPPGAAPAERRRFGMVV